VSPTVIVWLAAVVLVQSSVAVQVHVMVSGQMPFVVQTTVMLTLVSQLSAALTVGRGGISLRH
jgi:hypothetical protein